MTGAPDELAATLRAAGCVFAEDEVALILACARDPDEVARMVERRAGGTPLEVVTGWAEFCGLRVSVEAGVFVPRRRTEVLVREAVAVARSGSVVLDLCCGTGAVGAATHAQIEVELWASDVEPAAVRCARRNVEPLGGRVLEGDLYAALPAELRGRVDVLVCNAPYVPTGAIGLMPPEAREHEPRVTLDGGADGLDVQRRVVAGAAEWLSPVGQVLVETSREQAGRTAEVFAAAGLAAQIRHDDDVDGTVVRGGLWTDRAGAGPS